MEQTRTIGHAGQITPAGGSHFNKPGRRRRRVPDTTRGDPASSDDAFRLPVVVVTQTEARGVGHGAESSFPSGGGDWINERYALQIAGSRLFIVL
jgi:hypothetical protein